MTTIQSYKGDETELKYQGAAESLLDTISGSLDEFYAGADTTDDFLLMLYDEGRVPYSKRIKREAFVKFFKGALDNFPFIGSFDSYIFILKEIFGEDVDLFFEVSAPGKVSIGVNTAGDLLFDFVGRELIAGEYEYFNISTSDGDDLVFNGFSGIETEAELNLLFSEIMPAGIVPTISLEFYSKSTFYGSEGSDVFDMLTSFDDNIIFIEV
jgi:hypothetical protein